MKPFETKCLTLFLALAACPVHARVWYARPDATGDGSSWAAAGTIRAILSNPESKPGDEVWAAAGRHYLYPALTLKEGVSLYGGFAGWETARDERDPAASVTVLEGHNQDTVVHAGTGITAATVVDGFTITKGGGYRVYCCNPLPHVAAFWHHGGGLYIEGSPVIRNNDITANDAAHAASLSDPYAEEVPGDGGGIYIKGGSPQVLGNTIHANKARNGGGIMVAGGSPVIEGNSITDNHTNTDFQNGGGGIAIVASPSSSGITGGRVTRNVIRGNSALRGGGIHTQSSLVPLTRNRIQGNTARMGGGISIFHAMTALNNIIDGNTATEQGGGVAMVHSGMLRNNTITGNTSPQGALYLLAQGQTSIVNNIVAGNSTGVHAASPLNITMSANDVYGNGGQDYVGLTDQTDKNGNISADPLFTDADNGDYRLKSDSPAIDKGSDAAVATRETDFAGLPRTLGLHVDMGAHESPASNPSAFANAIRALRVAAGMDAYDPAKDDLLDILEPDHFGNLDIIDAAAWARKAIGLS